MAKARRSFYRTRKDGLMLLVMSYTKKEAMRIKIARLYQQANRMYAMLQVGNRQFEEERKCNAGAHERAAMSPACRIAR